MIAAVNSSLRQSFLLLHCQFLCARATLNSVVQRSRLMVAIMLFFLVSYQVIGTFLFTRGIAYIASIPGIGEMLIERMFYLIFFLFFLMLIFSNCILLFVGAFRSRQTAWLISLPVQPEALFAGRLGESITFSSWGLVILSAPLLLSYGNLFDAGPLFYLASLGLILFFIIVPAAIAAILVLTVTTWWPKGFKGIIPILLLLVGLLTWNLQSTAPQDIVDADVASARMAISDYLRHTELAAHPLLPNTWVSTSVLGWLGVHDEDQGGFHFLLTASQALMGLLAASFLAKHFYLKGWARSARRISRSGSESREDQTLRKSIIPPGPLLRYRALLYKDALTFIRDPSQWIQSVIIIGLLIVYILNIGNMGYDFENPFWHTVISFLNLTVCSLALSTLTTRFVFPQFSFEGRRLWVIGVAPFSIANLLWLKLAQSIFITGLISIGLMVLSSHVLELDFSRGAYFCSVMLLLCSGLCAYSAGLGSIFPNFQESNPAKMVSGFGGTLCLISSFILLVGVISTAALPDVLRIRAQGHPSSLTQGHALAIIATAVLVTSLAVLVPAARKVKRLDYRKIP